MEQIPNDIYSRKYKYVDWVFPLIRSRTLFGGERISIVYFGEEFYSNLLKSLTSSTELERYHGQMELIINTTDENFFAYNESCQTSNSIVMNRAVYTNIDNGYGLFAAISYESDYIRINNQSKTRIRNLEGLNFVGGIPE